MNDNAHAFDIQAGTFLYIVNSAANRMFDRTSDIRISEKVHGPAGARRYSYLPTFILRGLTHIGLEFDPVGAG